MVDNLLINLTVQVQKISSYLCFMSLWSVGVSNFQTKLVFVVHCGCFLWFVSIKYDTNFNSRCQRKEIRKIEGSIVRTTFENWYNNSAFIFSDFLLVGYLKLRFVSSTFWTKISKNDLEDLLLLQLVSQLFAITNLFLYCRHQILGRIFQISTPQDHGDN